VLHQLGTTTLDGASYTGACPERSRGDLAGNRKTRTDKRLGTTLTYAYDNIYQLLMAEQGTTTKESYTGACPERYSSREAMRVSRRNPVGNRLSSVGVNPYQYNASNQLTSIPGTTYTYDNNGNTKTKTTAAGTTAYTWDFENRLTQVALPGTTGTVTYKYDPFGRRVQKAFTQGGTTTTTNYLYDGRNSLEELDATGNVLARYNQGPSIDEPISELRGSTTSFYQMDFLGSITSLSNSAGALANTYTYDSFGKLNASAGTLTNPFQFTGREFDPETGIYNYRMRYYDQNVGRFLSEDPIGFGGGVNFYRYADGNPISETDPLGLDTKVCYYSDAAAGFGHVGFGLPQEGEQGTWGFYPTGNPIDSPGKVKPDEQKKPQCKTIPAPKDKDQCMLQCRLKRLNNPGNYKVTSRQCTSFVRECLRECGEPAGNFNGPRPWPFFDGLPK
jgi:RHS repeat-associated protein